ncbi:sporulation protein Cse60 [Paenibacillus sp. GCM10027626]|uniref:sporulation protein Cse60 n=1 Tax=Paenibacillus sp. GCM10027626 TaxID=3273411 RepID=UPI00362D0311
MIQVKEFVDTDNSYAENKANQFLATLDENQFIDIRYGSVLKPSHTGTAQQRSSILVIYRTKQ